MAKLESGGTVARLDVRIPIDLYKEIEALAKEQGAKINHKSGEVTVAPTLLDLLRVGLKHYSPDAVVSVRASDRASDNRIDLEAFKDDLLAQLRTELQPQPNLTAELAELKDEVEALKKSELQPVS